MTEAERRQAQMAMQRAMNGQVNFGSPGVAGVPSNLPGGGPQLPQGIRSVGSMAQLPTLDPIESPMNQMRSGGQSGGGGILRSIGDALKDYGPLALAGFSAVEGYQANRRSEEMMKKAIQAEEERKAMVQRGRERRAGMQSPDYSPIFASDNPYSRIRPVGRGA